MGEGRMPVREKAKTKSRHNGRSNRRPRTRGRAVAQGYVWPELQYVADHMKELEAYSGEWLLIEGRDLLAHSADIKVIKKAVKKNGIRAPFVQYVPTKEEANSIFI